MDCRNYREISLLDTSYKILSNVLLARLKPYGEEIVGEYQAGFRAGKSTVDFDLYHKTNNGKVI